MSGSKKAFETGRSISGTAQAQINSEEKDRRTGTLFSPTLSLLNLMKFEAIF
jgi:hypothetical protein